MNELEGIHSLKKILVILSDTDDWLGKSMQNTGLVDVAAAYKRVPHCLERLRTLNYHLPVSKNRWYDSWKDSVAKYDTIILFDVFLASDMAEYIETHAPKTRLIIYYYNPWHNNYYVTEEARSKCEIWSFDRQDCEKYGLKYNHQFYFEQKVERKKDIRYLSDVFFLGKDKGRLSFLREIKKIFSNNNIKAKLLVLPDRKIYSKIERNLLCDTYLPYEESLQYVANTACLLEVVQDFQEGITRRMMEAMFFGKKIITTNKNVCEYDFYDKRNIYIWGQDERDVCDFVKNKLPAFWKPEVLRRYSFVDWLNNFAVDRIK